MYQYLQRRYGIDGVSLHWEPDAPPALSGWTELRRQLASRSATVMVWEDTPLPETVSRLADLGIETVAFHTLANRPAQGDFITAMLDNARRLEALLQAYH